MTTPIERALLAIAFMALATSWVVQTEIDRLIGGVLGGDQRVFTLQQVQSPSSLRMTGAWQSWATADDAATTSALLTVYCLVEIGFYVSYCFLAWRMFVAVGRSPAVIGVVFGLELFETAGMLCAAHAGPEQRNFVAVVVALIALAKWSAIGAAVIWFLAHSPSRMWLATKLRIMVLGIRAQRIPFVMLVVVGILGIAYGGAVLEQVPDIERTWFDRSGPGAVHLIAAGACMIAVAVPLFFLARARSARYATLVAGPSVRPDGLAGPWLVLAVAPCAIGYVLSWTGNAGAIDLAPLRVVSLVLLLVVGASLVLRQIAATWPANQGDWLGPGERGQVTPSQAATVLAAGDLIVALIFAFATLGVVRALSAPVVLSLDPTVFQGTTSSEIIGPIRVAFIVAVVVSVFSVVVLLLARNWLVGLAGPGILPPTPPWVRPTLLLLLSAACVTVILTFALNPIGAPDAVGPIATLTALTGAWSILFGVVVLALDTRKPLEVFRVLRLRSTPVITIAIVAPLILTVVGSASGNHIVERTTPTALSARDDIPAALDTWLASSPCRMASDGNVIPLIVGAAEGGGIRAATWTTDVYRIIAQDRPECARNVFLSTGASGGSVGLAMFRRDDPGQIAQASDVNTIGVGQPGGLATTISAALTTDAIAATTGLRIPTATTLDSAPAWHDRAGVMQAQWASSSPQVEEPYDLVPLAPTGYLVFNSVDAVTQCKVVISQLELASSADPSEAETGACNSKRSGLGATYDLLDYEGECPLDMDWATVAGLSARFPVISPAGKVDGPGVAGGTDCTANSLQLIDGGYVDNPGLGTLSDIAPVLARAIAARNAQAEPAGGPFIVPIVMYVSNAPKTDVEGSKVSLLPEATIPLTSKVNAPSKQVEATSWLARISSDFEGACSTADVTCVGMQNELRTSIPSGVVLVAPGTHPSITEPLGWALSSVSRTQLNQEALEEAAKTTTDPDDDHASLGSLVGLFAPTK